MLIGTALALVLTSCSSSKSTTEMADTAAPATTAAAAAATSVVSATAGGNLKTGGAPAPPAAADKDQTVVRKVAITMSMDLEVREVLTTGVKIRSFVEASGGYVAGEQTSLGKTPSAVIVAKLPPGKVDELLNQISTFGKVLARNQQADDVTAQYVDLASRIGSQRASLARMQELYAKAANVDELARLEGELTKRQSDLELMFGQQRVLDHRVDLATLTITLHPEPEVAPTTTVKGLPPLGTALKDSVSTLGRAAKGLVYVLVVLLPWLIVAAIVAIPLLVVSRRRRAQRIALLEAAAEQRRNNPLPPPHA